jgi:hypothetical protein
LERSYHPEQVWEKLHDLEQGLGFSQLGFYAKNERLIERLELHVDFFDTSVTIWRNPLGYFKVVAEAR